MATPIAFGRSFFNRWDGDGVKFLLISPKNRTVYNFRGDLIRAIIARGYEVVVTGPDQTDVDRITALGARFVEIPMNKTGTSIRGDLRYCKALTRLMKAEKPDVTLRPAPAREDRRARLHGQTRDLRRHRRAPRPCPAH